MMLWSAKKCLVHMFTKHNQLLQNTKCDRYAHFLDEEKSKVFNREVPFAEAICTHFEGDKKRLYFILVPKTGINVKMHFVSDATLRLAFNMDVAQNESQNLFNLS